MRCLLAIVAICVVGAVSADVSSDAPAAPTCGLLERVKVRRQWAHAFGEGEHRLDFVIAVWSNFFKAYPKARELFKNRRADNIYSVEFQAHGHRVLGALGMIIATSDDPAVVKVILDAIKTNHKEKGIKTEYYEAFRDELLETLPEYVGRHFDYDAWHACLDTIINGVKQ